MSKEKKRGHLISMEGIDGSGKSTQVTKIHCFLNELGIDSICTKEPGGSHSLGHLKEILTSPENPIHPLAEVFLFMADRAQHVSQVIQPALERGVWVISDRYTDSTLAYQGYGKGIDLSLLQSLNQKATAHTSPCITFLLDIDPKKGLKRAATRLNNIKNAEKNTQEDRFEKESLEFHNRVRNGFLELAKAETERFVVIDADRDAHLMFEDIKSSILSRFLI